MAKLTPALLAGKEHKEKVTLTFDDQSFEIEIRPLTHMEKTEIQAIESASIKVDAKTMTKAGSESMEMNAGELLKDQARAQLKMIALATIDDEWTENNIDQLWKAEWIETVSKRIAEISGIDGNNINSFRKE